MANATTTSIPAVPSDKDGISKGNRRKIQPVTAKRGLYAIQTIVPIPIPASNCGQEVSVKGDRKVQINKLLNPYQTYHRLS